MRLLKKEFYKWLAHFPLLCGFFCWCAVAQANLAPVSTYEVRSTENLTVDLELGADDFRGGGQLLLLVKLRNGSTRKFDLNRTRTQWPGGHKEHIEINVTPAIQYADMIDWGLEWHGSRGDLLQEQDDVDIAKLTITSTAHNSPRGRFLGKVTVATFPLSGGAAITRLENDQTRWFGQPNPMVEVAAVCQADADCDDGIFCNGLERCTLAATGSDARGCARGTPACGLGQQCDERAQRCAMPCPDADGDGHSASHCGGDDCDDSDANRFPGNVEIQDAADHDEDCDVNTHGFSRGAMSAQICDGRDKVVLVDASERFTRANCMSGTVCVPQPNGSGVCMSEPPRYQAPGAAALPRGPQAAPPATLRINNPASTANPEVIAPPKPKTKKGGGD